MLCLSGSNSFILCQFVSIHSSQTSHLQKRKENRRQKVKSLQPVFNSRRLLRLRRLLLRRSWGEVAASGDETERDYSVRMRKNECLNPIGGPEISRVTDWQTTVNLLSFNQFHHDAEDLLWISLSFIHWWNEGHGDAVTGRCQCCWWQKATGCFFYTESFGFFLYVSVTAVQKQSAWNELLLSQAK